MSQWQPPGPPPPENPYGGGYSAYEPGQRPPGNDGVSIAAFVCALTCCAAPVGIGLGIAGIVRTKDGKRRGRWAAVTGVVLGVVGTLVFIAGIVGVVLIGTNVLLEEDAEVGDCANTGLLGADTDDLWKADCADEHDAEIVAVLVATRALEQQFDEGDPIDQICAPFVDDAYKQALTNDEYRMDFATDAFDEEISDGDWLICYLERVDGEKLEGSLAGGGAAGA